MYTDKKAQDLGFYFLGYYFNILDISVCVNSTATAVQTLLH